MAAVEGKYVTNRQNDMIPGLARASILIGGLLAAAVCFACVGLARRRRGEWGVGWGPSQACRPYAGIIHLP